ncbi:MAG: glycosyltransferase family 1 protein [Bacteroidota bacterium]
MRVVINTEYLSEVYSAEYINFLCKTFERIVKSNPEHTFIFLCKKQHAHIFTFEKNAQVYIIKQSPSSLLLWKYWYDVKIPVILRKLKADVFISTGGFCSLTTKIPRCIILQDLAFLHFPSFFAKRYVSFLKKNTKKFTGKAKRIVTLSDSSKKDIIKQYDVDENKIDIVYNGSEILQSFSEDLYQEIKEKYTEGKNFFIYCGSLHRTKNLINLLKAFSVFKKRQQSSMKLLLCATSGADKSLIKSLQTYKYRNDVVYLDNIEEDELTKLVASSYALVYPAYFDAFCFPLLEAFRCGVPVITSENPTMQEIAGDAALYADPGNYNTIAEQLMLIYKDENKRTELIKAGQLITQRYSWNKMADLLWDSIQKAAL